MSQLNLQINAIAFADNTASNNPLLRHFDLTYKLLGMAAKNPDQKPYTIAPGATQTIYDGTRSNLLDNTTQLNVTKPYADKATYRFIWNGVGTNPAFRTDRLTTINGTTVMQITVNGPVVTMTSTAGPFVTTNIQVGDILLMQPGCGNSAVNQGNFVIIAKTATSVSYQSINGAGETFTVIDPTKLLIYSNGGNASNQIQIGDKLAITSGFSLATQSTYEITEVTPTWLEIAVGSPNGLPLESGITPTVGGFTAYVQAKKFVLVAAQQSVVIRLNNDISDNVLIEPVEEGNPERAGLLIKNGSFFKLVIVNNGINSANLIVATVE